MKFLTENEEHLVDRLSSYPTKQYRIGNKLVGIKYGNQRPKYVLLDMQDLTELEHEIKTDPDRLCSWIRRHLIHTVYVKTNP